jgi:hypothetical protein
VLVSGVAGASGFSQAQAAGVGGPGRPIDVALAIDTSGTMDRLLDAARTDMWDVLARLAADEPDARLRVAVLTYGSIYGGEQRGWVRIEAPLSADMDLVSSRLFSVRIAGDKEYVARVVRTAAEELEWDLSDTARRLIFVLGNESARQDPGVTLEEALQAAKDRKIEVVPVYCGKPMSNDIPSWVHLATLAGTTLEYLDPAKVANSGPTPFDETLATLSSSFSATFLPMGEDGSAAKTLQEQQDSNAASLGPVAAALRAEVKAGSRSGASWDLVDAVASGRVSIESVAEADLPKSLRPMSVSERAIHLSDAAERREQLRAQILDLAAQRRRQLAETGKKDAAGAGLSEVILNAIRAGEPGKN